MVSEKKKINENVNEDDDDDDDDDDDEDDDADGDGRRIIPIALGLSAGGLKKTMGMSHMSHKIVQPIWT